MRKSSVTKVVALVLAAGLHLGANFTGCTGEGGGVLPGLSGSIRAVQLFDQPNFTVAFSIESLFISPSNVARVNWVFGDGTGFVQGPAGRTTITHRYLDTGTFMVTAFVFDLGDNVTQIDGQVTVAPANGGGTDPEPTELPAQVAGLTPSDGAQMVNVETLLSWAAAARAASYDVYLGLVEADVENADNTSADIFQGNFAATQFDPDTLTPDTQFFWRVDSRNVIGTTKGVVQRFRTARAPAMIRQPTPANGVTTAPIAQVLTWLAGDGATSHDVYFGKDMTAVADATTESEDVFQGNQTATTFDPSDEMAEEAGDLLPDTMYYWRVDEVGPGGTTQGTVLMFRTRAAPERIDLDNNPMPIDGETDVGTDDVLSWIAGPGIDSFDVYLGIDAAAVDNAVPASDAFQQNQTSTIFAPGNLLGGTTYFWRIDSINPGGKTKGQVFSFTTAALPPMVMGPFTPVNNATGVDVDVILQWAVSAAGATTSYDVYFGTSQSAVASGADSVFQGNQDRTDTTFDPGELAPGTRFYWRIDAVGPGGVTIGQLLNFRMAPAPDKATAPMPANQALGVALDAVLSWTAGSSATSHDVYFGTSQSAVDNADQGAAEFQGNQPGTMFTPENLTGDTTFFWRIDEVGPGGTTKGNIWRFKTRAAPAAEPMPGDGAAGVDPNSNLQWTAGAGAASHDVYLGTDETDVMNATQMDPPGIFRINTTSTTFNPVSALMPTTTYFWRIDERTSNGFVTTGAVWMFTTNAGVAQIPSPADGASGVSVAPTLMWMANALNDPGVTVTHDVYLGTNESAVRDATRMSPQFQGNQAGTSFMPADDLMGNTTYFWRIDEVTDDGTTKGAVWQFQTQQVAPPMVTTPSPFNGATNVAVTTVLNWAVSSGATGYDVYLSTVQADVTNREAGALQSANQPGTSFDPMPDLTAGTTYFWAIDATNSAGTTPGDVWSFTTAP